jgi:hypothetical protein
VGATAIVRGLRGLTDFEVELSLAHNNAKLAPEVETVCLMTSLEVAYISSSLVKEIARFGGNVSGMVPPASLSAVMQALAASRCSRRGMGRATNASTMHGDRSRWPAVRTALEGDGRGRRRLRPREVR